jgi:phosphate transport system protein
MNNPTITPYRQEQLTLEQTMLKMGGLCEAQLTDAITALETFDRDVAARVIANDPAIDRLEHDIEHQVTDIIAKRAPVPLVLRGIMGAMRIAGDLERIGDLAKNIAKRLTTLDAVAGQPKLVKGISRMADIAIAQLKTVLDAYSQGNVELAKSVWRRDEELDNLYNSVFRELLTYMMEDPRTISYCTHLLFCAKNIERIGDHCTNIAEIVTYIVTGVELGDGRPKGDHTSETSIEPTHDSV